MNPTITEKQERFLALRSQGKTYDQIATDLGVSRRPLFYWNKELQEDLAFEETAELESLRQELLGTREARARRLAKRLAAIEEELDKRSLTDLSTARLFSLADSLRRQLIRETTPQTRGRAKLQLSRDQRDPLESEESAMAVQPENNTPSPLPEGEKDGMRGPSARPAFASSFVGSPIQESTPSTNNHLSSVALAEEDQLSTSSPQCNESAITVQPASESLRTPCLCVEEQRPKNRDGQQCNDSAKMVQSVPPTTIHQTVVPSTQPPRCQPISPERLIGPNISFLEVWQKQKQARLTATPG